MWFHQESGGKFPSPDCGGGGGGRGGGEGGEAHPPQWKDFSIPRITVICTYAIFEPGLQIVVTLSLICGTCPPVETD